MHLRDPNIDVRIFDSIVVVELLGILQYKVKVDGSGHITFQNRVFLCRITPFIKNTWTESRAKLDVKKGVYTGSKKVTVNPSTPEGTKSHEPSPTRPMSPSNPASLTSSVPPSSERPKKEQPDTWPD